jgi:predicted alpha-1,2-mannosidase
MHRRARRLVLAALTAATVAAIGVGPPAIAAAPSRAAGRSAPHAALVSDPASLVNTRVLATGGPNDFPGADVPFGLVQWSPDTVNRADGGGYNAGDTQFRGFGLTHIAGPGCGAMGDVPILPMTGGLPGGDPGSHVEPFTHSGEMGTAGYYTVTSGSSPIRTELTATQRSAMARFTFPATSQADVLIKLLDSENGTFRSTAQVVSSTEVMGSATSGHFCGAGDVYTVNFDIVFDHPFTGSQVVNEPNQPGPNSVFLTFNTTASQVVQAKVGISYVSGANARQNVQQENPSFNFDAVRSAAHSAWNALLTRVLVGGGTAAQQQLFYTSLYHALLHPNVFSDVNGQYMGFDNQVHTVSGGQRAQYANYSGWDIYRSQAQLSALVAPQQMSDSAQSMLNDAAQSGGQLPKWALNNGETYVMVGDPGTAILSDYFAFGARSFDTSAALQVMLHEATQPGNVRPGLAEEMRFGYLPDDLSYGCCNFNGSLSTLLEYNIADFALSRFATAMGDSGDASSLLARAQNWKNVFNPANQLLDTRLQNGSFVSVTPTSFGPGYVEGTAAQYRWLVPFNQRGLADALGGNGAVNPMLDFFFRQLNPNPDDGAALHNEVDIGMPYFYDWTGMPSHAQEVNHRVRTQMYADSAGGFPDNDDLGTMSAAYVWTALGMYPATPGTADLAFNSPLFPNAAIQLPGGNMLTINAPGASESSFYVQSLNVNGAASTKTYLPASMLTSGGTLDFAMGSSPSSWGTGPNDAPPSYGTGSSGGGGQPLSALFNNAGISDDSNQGAANFDHDGFSYSQQQLSGAGLGPGATVGIRGLRFAWPNVSSGRPDNVEVSGQTVSVSAPAGATRLGLLGSATNGSASGTATITYTDGTTQTFRLHMTDWAVTAQSGNRVVATMSHRNSVSGSSDNIQVFVFEQDVTLGTGKQVASVTLPASVSGGQLHVFAVAAA